MFGIRTRSVQLSSSGLRPLIPLSLHRREFPYIVAVYELTGLCSTHLDPICRQPHELACHWAKDIASFTHGPRRPRRSVTDGEQATFSAEMKLTCAEIILPGLPDGDGGYLARLTIVGAVIERCGRRRMMM